jgi:P pilus assembly chaperone PapD
MKLLLIFSLSLAVTLTGQCATAFSMSPMTADYELTGDKASVVYTINNPSDTPLAVEVSVEARSTSIDGREINDKSLEVKKNFTIFPAAMIIPPKQKKGVRVVYVGPKDITTEKTYRINVVEKPSRDSTTTAQGVKMLLEFRTTAYVGPKTATPALAVKKVTENDGGKLKIDFLNSGTGHQLVHKIALKFTDSLGNSATITDKEEPKLLSNFLAAEEVIIEVIKPAALKGKTLSATIEVVE